MYYRRSSEEPTTASAVMDVFKTDNIDAKSIHTQKRGALKRKVTQSLSAHVLVASRKRKIDLKQASKEVKRARILINDLSASEFSTARIFQLHLRHITVYFPIH